MTNSIATKKSVAPAKADEAARRAGARAVNTFLAAQREMGRHLPESGQSEARLA
jgi:hypothetical protein